VHRLQQAADRLSQEKAEIEQRAAEQAETTRQLSEANDTLSARALALAEEAASAGDSAKRLLDGQLVEMKAALASAQEEAAVLQDRNMNMMIQQAEMYAFLSFFYSTSPVQCLTTLTQGGRASKVAKSKIGASGSIFYQLPDHTYTQQFSHDSRD
jgi:hypothetical protein